MRHLFAGSRALLASAERPARGRPQPEASAQAAALLAAVSTGDGPPAAAFPYRSSQLPLL